MLVIKTCISALIIAFSAYIGILKSRKLKSREYILREMITFLTLIENDIKYMMNILPNAYESSRQKLSTKLKDVIGQIVIDMLSYDSTYLINQSIVENVSKLDELTDYDKNIFISILKNLGKSDLDSQINIIENGISVLENQVKEASEFKLVNSKLYKTMGVIAGIMLVIIFI